MYRVFETLGRSPPPPQGSTPSMLLPYCWAGVSVHLLPSLPGFLQGACVCVCCWGWGIGLQECALRQQSPTFSAPGTGFMEDSFSTDGGGRRGDGFGTIQVHHYVCCALDFYSYYYIVTYNAIIIQLTINTDSVGALHLFSCSPMVPSGGDGRITCHSSPAVWPSFRQVTDWYWSVARGLGTPTLRLH